MNSYEEKKQAKIERFERYAENARKRSESRYKQAHTLSNCIPMGQPILVGHHSEGRHRRDLKRIDNDMRKSLEEEKKAEYFEKKIDRLENNNTIESDNPNAINLLNEKMKNLIDTKEKMKKLNKKAKKEKKKAFYGLSIV